MDYFKAFQSVDRAQLRWISHIMGSDHGCSWACHSKGIQTEWEKTQIKSQCQKTSSSSSSWSRFLRGRVTLGFGRASYHRQQQKIVQPLGQMGGAERGVKANSLRHLLINQIQSIEPLSCIFGVKSDTFALQLLYFSDCFFASIEWPLEKLQLWRLELWLHSWAVLVATLHFTHSLWHQTKAGPGLKVLPIRWPVALCFSLQAHAKLGCEGRNLTHWAIKEWSHHLWRILDSDELLEMFRNTTSLFVKTGVRQYTSNEITRGNFFLYEEKYWIFKDKSIKSD